MAASLDERVRDWFASLKAPRFVPSANETANAMREALGVAMEAIEGPPPSLADVRDVPIGGPTGDLRGRLYTPLAAGLAPAPLLIFFHGGGFVIGDLNSHDRLCRRLSAKSHIRVLAVDYRLAPDHPFPAAYDDALAAFDWAVGPGADAHGFDPARVAVGGDSAGGNLATAVAQARRRRGAAPAFQLLLYPWMQLAETKRDTAKVIEGHLLSSVLLDRARHSYVRTADEAMDVRASPLFEVDLAGLAPAHVITCGLDPLHDEGRAYAERLAAAAVAVTHEHYPTVPHGFMQYTAFSKTAVQAVEDASGVLRTALRV